MSTEISNQNDEISLKELIQKLGEWYRYLKTQWWKILFAGLLGSTIGFFYASRQPITYTAKTTFVVEEGKGNSPGLGGLASLAGQFGVDVGGSSGGGLLSGDNILLYFKSGSLAREVLLSKYDSASTKSIADVYADVYKLKDGWVKNQDIGNITFEPYSISTKYTRLHDSLLQTIIAGVLANKFSVAKTDKKAGFIDVAITMESEALAKIYCERVVQIAVDRYLSVKTHRQKSTVDNLQARVDSIAELLSNKTRKGAVLQTSTSTMDINPLYRTGAAVAVETTIRDKTMLSTIFASVTQNLELAKFTLSQETPVIQIIDEPRLPLTKIKKSRLKMAILFSFGLAFLVVMYFVFKRGYSNLYK